MELCGDQLEALVCYQMGHPVMGDGKYFAPDIGLFIGGFLGNIWTVSTVILMSFKTKSVNQEPTRMLELLADKVIERIRDSAFAKAIIPLVFEV